MKQLKINNLLFLEHASKQISLMGMKHTQTAEEIEYQLMMINRILTVWFEVENAQPIFS